MLMFSCMSKNDLNFSTPYFFSWFEYMLYNLAHHIFTTMTKSHTNVSRAYANLINAWIDSNKGMMQASSIITSMSQIYYRLVFVVATICKSSCIFTTKVLYFVKNHLVGNNMEIHLIFTLRNNFRPLVSSNLAIVPCSKIFLCEDEKYVYVVCSNPWVYQLIKKFALLGPFDMPCNVITKGATLDLSWVATLIYNPMNTSTPFDSKNSTCCQSD